jgi:hypothetical protein
MIHSYSQKKKHSVSWKNPLSLSLSLSLDLSLSLERMNEEEPPTIRNSEEPPTG